MFVAIVVALIYESLGHKQTSGSSRKCTDLGFCKRFSDPEYAEKLRNNPTVQLAVKSFRTMRRSALTPVARRLRDVMVQRYPVYPPAVNLDALNNADWTEVSISQNEKVGAFAYLAESHTIKGSARNTM